MSVLVLKPSMTADRGVALLCDTVERMARQAEQLGLDV